MTLAERLAQLPDTALVPVSWVRELLVAENGAPGWRRSDDHDAAGSPDPPPVSTNGDRLLTAREVADRLGCSTRYVYARASSWPFTVRLDGRAVRFSPAGLERWLACPR